MRRTVDDVTTEVAALGDLHRDALALLWEKAHGNRPPKAIRNDLLARSAAWHLQAKGLGGFSAGTRRNLREAMVNVESDLAKPDTTLMPPAEPTRDSDAASDTQRRSQLHPLGPSAGSTAQGARKGRAIPAPAVRLFREWNGKNYVVDVIEGGFVFQAKVHSH